MVCGMELSKAEVDVVYSRRNIMLKTWIASLGQVSVIRSSVLHTISSVQL